MTTSALTFTLCCATAAVFATLRTANAQPTSAAAESAASTEAVGTPDGHREARLFYARGQAAYRAHDLEEARRLFLRAWSLRRTYDVASALGQAELSLNRPRDAAEHLDFAIRNFPPQLKPDDLDRVRQVFSRAEKQVGTVLVRVDRAGAEVGVDGQTVGKSPLEHPLFLNPGQHAIEAREGSDHASLTVTAAAGVQQSLTLTLAEPRPFPSTAAVTDAARPSTNLTPLVLGGAVTLVGAGFGLGFAVVAASAHDSANSWRASLSPGACAAPAPASGCAEFRDRAESYDRSRKLATVGFAVSATALVATVGYWFLSGTRATQRTPGARSPVRMGGTFSADSAALSMTGAW